MEEKITMKEHVEILSKQQDYQFAEGFRQGMKEEQLKLIKFNKELEDYKKKVEDVIKSWSGIVNKEDLIKEIQEGK